MEANEVIAIGIIVIAGVLILGGIWFGICNHWTLKQRLKIIDWIYDDPIDWHARLRAYNRVTYEQHHWALITFRDPRTLYKFD